MTWSEAKLDEIFAKAIAVSDDNERTGFRKDQCGAWIQRSQHGNANSQYGWEVDHITPDARGGSEEIGNLRPLQWENNRARGDGNLVCVVKSEGTKNIKV